MDRDEPRMRREGGIETQRRGGEPGREIAHQGRDLGRRGQYQRRTGDQPLIPAVAAGLLGVELGEDQPVDLAEVDLAQRLAGGGERAHKGERVAMADRLEMILQRLAADRDALFEDNRGFAAGQRIAFDGIRAVGQLDVIPGRQRREAARAQRTQSIELLLFTAQPVDRAAARHRAAVRDGKLTASSIPAGSSWIMISAFGKARRSRISTSSEISCARNRLIMPSISRCSWIKAVGPAIRVRMSCTAVTSGWLSAIARTRARSASGSSRSISWVKDSRAILVAL